MTAPRRMARRTMLVGATMAMCIVSGAAAYFVSTGTGKASATAGSLGRPAISSAVAGAGTVTLSWTSVAQPGGGAVTYYLTRDGGDPAGNCPASSAPKAVTSCTDAGLALATHTYTVTAVWKSWSKTSPPVSASVTFGPATHLVLQAATSTPTAGAADNLSITAKDASGNTVQTYAGAHSLSFSGAAPSGSFSPTVADSSGAAIAFGTATSIQFTGGVASVSGSSNGVMKLYKVQTASIALSDGTIGNSSSPLSVTVGPAGASTLTLSGYPSPTTSGTSHTFSAILRDPFGNLATGYTGTVKFTSSDTGAALPANYTFTSGTAADNGTHTFSATLKTAGTQSLTATDTTASTIAGTQSGIVVSASKLVLSALSTTPAAGVADNLTVTAQDALGNTATNYTGSHVLTFSGASPSPNGTQPTVTSSSGAAILFGSSTAIGFTNGVASVTGSSNGAMTLYDAQTAGILATDGAIGNSASPLSVTVSPPPAPAANPSSRYAYLQQASPTPDAIEAAGGTLKFGTGETSLALVAIETLGPHTNQQFASPFTSSSGAPMRFNLDNAQAQTVSYEFAQKDPWGNLSTSFAGPFSYADIG